MALTTPNLNLTVWNLGQDDYDYDQLASNWMLLDNHDHSPGKGVQVGTTSIQNNAITSNLLAPDSVTNSQLAPDSVGSAQLQAGAVTIDSLDVTDIYNAILPVGAIISWWRPSFSIPLPTGFELCDGTTYGPTQHQFSGGGSITVPDLRNRFILGAIPASSPGDNGPNSAPNENTTGGSNSQNISHSHSINTFYTTNTHGHTVTNHSHSISADGNHYHTLNGADLLSRESAFAPYWFSDGLQFKASDGNFYPNNLQEAVIQNVPNPAVDPTTNIPMDMSGNHNHGGNTGGSAPATSVDQITSDPVNISTNQFSYSQDFRGNFYGLLFLIKLMAA
jgi:hypothetical protein